jgi:hypothetical protein
VSKTQGLARSLSSSGERKETCALLRGRACDEWDLRGERCGRRTRFRTWCSQRSRSALALFTICFVLS